MVLVLLIPSDAVARGRPRRRVGACGWGLLFGGAGVWWVPNAFRRTLAVQRVTPRRTPRRERGWAVGGRGRVLGIVAQAPARNPS